MLAAAGALLFFRRRPPQNPIYPTRKRRTKKARHRFLIHCRDAPCGYPGFSIQTGTGYPRGVPYDGKNYGFVGAGLASALIGTATQRRAPARGAPTCFYHQGHPRGVPLRHPFFGLLLLLACHGIFLDPCPISADYQLYCRIRVISSSLRITCS